MRKVLKQVSTDSDHVVSFWYGPETAVIVLKGQTGPVDCCERGYLSFRARGEFALTRHSTIFGGMRALSQEGQCDYTPPKP